MTAAIESIHDFLDVKSCLLESLWYGKYAVQWVWGKPWFRGIKTKVPLRWEPLHGDKIGYQWQDSGTAGHPLRAGPRRQRRFPHGTGRQHYPDDDGIGVAAGPALAGTVLHSPP